MIFNEFIALDGNCKRCGELCSTPAGLDPTPLCNLCAQAVAEAVLEAVAAVKQKNPTLWLSDPFGYCVCSVCRSLRVVLATRKGSDEKLSENLQEEGH